MKTYKIKKLSDIHLSIKRVLEYDTCFSNLDDRLNLIQSFGRDEKCMYGTNGGEYFIYDVVNKNIRFYDFAYKNKIIEFHGDYWHKNPLFYERDEIVETADKYKLELANTKGKELLIIWEYNYYKNPASTLQDALTFLTT